MMQPYPFPAPNAAFVSDRRVFRIDQLESGGEAVVTTLRAQLQSLWDWVFADAPAEYVILCEVSYVYGRGGSGQPAVPLIVCSLHVSVGPTSVEPVVNPSWLSTPKGYTATILLDSIADETQRWFDTSKPTVGCALVFDEVTQLWTASLGPGGGLLLLDLSVWTGPAGPKLRSPVLVLNLWNLALPLSSISPPLMC
jgi:hypothetical protein